jgi:PBSX family phage portal protein
MANESESTNSLAERVEPGQGTAALTSLVKAMFIGEEGGSQSRAMSDQARETDVFKNSGALPPVYDPGLLTLIFEASSALRPNVDAYVTNIDSYGHTYEPVIDVESPEAQDKVRDALRIEGAAKAKDGGTVAAEPTDEEVAARLEELKPQIRAERAMLENFFENCTPEIPFSGPEGLRGLTRQDIEVIGSGYWEVLRNKLGEVSTFAPMPARSIRLMPMGRDIVEVKVQRRVSLLTSKEETVQKRFRMHIQISETGDQVVYFKEFGDPRAVDAKTGKAYVDVATAEREAAANRSAFIPATEILPFRITSPRTPYGVPRWIGSLLAVLGTRQAEEVNFLYFENRSVPPLAVLVSGGRLNENSAKKLEDYIATEIRGKRNFHKILILEAEPAAGSDSGSVGKMKIELRPLVDAQQKDALFQQYDERNADKVGQSFRLPRLLRGDVRDFNRSTAEASVDFAEIQVFGPIRQQFDWIMNKLILPAIGVKYHTFKSNAPTVRDPEALSTMIKDLVTASVITPGEARELAAGVFNKDFEKIKAVWTSQPIALTIAGRSVEDNLNTPEDEASEFDTLQPDIPAGDSPGHGAGVMSTGGAAATQAALGVDQSKADASLGIGVSAALRVAKQRRRDAALKSASILARVHAVLMKAEREVYAHEQREYVKVPRDIFESFVVPNEEGGSGGAE